jgi:hypothetical protein
MAHSKNDENQNNRRAYSDTQKSKFFPHTDILFELFEQFEQYVCLEKNRHEKRRVVETFLAEPSLMPLL